MAVIHMLGTVALTPRHIDDYAAVVGEKRIADLRRLAAPLEGLRLVGLSMNAFGSWSTDLLATSIPLMQDLGLRAEWRVVRTDQEFVPMTRAIYEALSGTGVQWTPGLQQQWDRYTAVNRSLIESRYDVVIVHDPQLLGLIPEQLPAHNGRQVHWVWRSHLDLSSADRPTWEMLRPFAERYDAVMFEDAQFAPPNWRTPTPDVVRPGMDPLGPRSVGLDYDAAAAIAGRLGIDTTRPLIAQLSPFDEGSDVIGLIEVFDALLRLYPELQLVIVPTAIRDDEQTRDYFNRIAALVGERPGCILLTQGDEIGNTEVNAIATVSTIVVQKALRKGFALWLSEAMWKEKPIVAGRTAGTVAQVRDGETGFLVANTEIFAARTATLLGDPGKRREMGANARRHVADHYLVTRYLSDVFRILSGVVGALASR